MKVIVVFIAIICSAQAHDEKTNIVGSWVSEDDQAWVIIFKSDNRYYQLYDGEVVESGKYNITYGIPPDDPYCRPDVKPRGSESTLKMVSSDNDSIYYEINGVTSKNLSLTWTGNANVFVFDRR